MAIVDLQRRLHQAGRIRLGDKQETTSGKMRPAKLSQFRFTSSDQHSLDQVAAVYGGEVVPWDGNGSGDKFELYTSATSLNVLVPPVDLIFSQWYEDWSGAVCRHRCDGVDDVKTDHSCSCDPENRVCKPTTRVSVIIQEVMGIGTWRLETHGWSAASELSGTIELLRALQATKPVPARLMLREDTRKAEQADGSVQTHHFVVPVLDPILSIAQLTGGNAPAQLSSVTPLQQAEPPAAPIADQVTAVNIPPERPVRANAATPLPSTGLRPQPVVPTPPRPSNQNAQNAQSERTAGGASKRSLGKLMGDVKRSGIVGETDDERYKWASIVLGGAPVTTFNDLNQREVSCLIDVLAGKDITSPREQSSRPQSSAPSTAQEPPDDLWDDEPPF